MKIELGSQALYQRYQDIRESLPLFYCKSPFQYRVVEGGVNLLKTVDKGFYRCEYIGSGRIKVYDTYVGIDILKNTFNYCFKKPNRLRLFLYKHFPSLWI